MEITKDRYAKEWAYTDKHLQQVTPSRPRPLLPDAAPPSPYPLDALTYELRSAAEAIMEHEQVPAAIAGQCVIGAATYLAQTRANAWHPRGKPGGAPCSLFMLSLFGSGEGKSSARKLAFKVIDEAEKEATTRYRKAYEQIMLCADQLKGKAREEYLAENPLPADPKTQYSDATFEPIAGDFIRGKPAACWDTDEGGQMLGGASLKSDTVAATLGGLTKGYDDGSFERARARGNAEGSGVAFNRRLSIHLLAQPITVVESLANPLLTGQGFLARFLLAAPDSLAGTCFITVESLERSAYDDPRLQSHWARCQEIITSPEHIDSDTGEVTPPVLTPNADAIKTWVNFRNEIEHDLGPLGNFAGLKPFARRGAEQALRLATVLSFYEGADHIDGDCMDRACKLARYSLNEWLRYTSVGSINPDLKRAADLMTWLLDPKRAANWQEFHINKLGKSGPPAIRSAKVRDKTLNILIKHCYLLTSDNKTFRINDFAENEDYEESEQPQGSAVADDLLKDAEVTNISPASNFQYSKLPQATAKLPQAETPQPQGFPQIPQHPQPLTPSESISSHHWELEL